MPRHALSKASSLSALLRCAEPPALFGAPNNVKGAKGTRGPDLIPPKLVRQIGARDQERCEAHAPGASRQGAGGFRGSLAFGTLAAAICQYSWRLASHFGGPGNRDVESRRDRYLRSRQSALTCCSR